MTSRPQTAVPERVHKRASSGHTHKANLIMVSETVAPVPLPLPPSPPPDFAYRTQDIVSSTGSDTTAFCTGILNRDVFGGVRCCVVCGMWNDLLLDNCHLIPKTETQTWQLLKRNHYVPDRVKSVEHESRNGLTLCVNHHRLFDHYQVFIRYVRKCDRYIYVNYCGSPSENGFHGKAVGLNSSDLRAPFPTVFLIHEIRTRGFHPFQPNDADIASPVRWQDWLYATQLIDSNGNMSKTIPNSSFSGNPTGNSFNQGQGLMVDGSRSTDEPPTTSNRNTIKISMTPDVIRDIVEVTQHLPSWKASEFEGSTWNGTAAQNIKKYEKEVGFER